jgi:hypothetical protein
MQQRNGLYYVQVLRLTSQEASRAWNGDSGPQLPCLPLNNVHIEVHGAQ